MSAATPPAARRLVVTADDFGLHVAVNEAVEAAHREGILTAASLMVSAPAAGDAVERAKRLPRLRVGLHIVLADGPATAPRARIPGLVGTDGRFGSRMARDGIRYFLCPSLRRQLETEIRAQFEAYAATGLVLDHVDAHKHFHLHPTLASMILQIGAEFGLKSMRVPSERGGPILLAPWVALMKRRLQARGIFHNDHVVGLLRTGRMDEPALLRALAGLPPGLTEIYLHPATLSGAAVGASMAEYRHADEWAALVSPRVRAAVKALGVPLGGYGDFAR